MTMKLYTVATKSSISMQGSNLEVASIGTISIWGDGPFPPLFKSKQSAEKYLDESSDFCDGIIVEMELVE